jgi:NDP-sugar pyrophosphorylase family protein
MRRWTTTLPKSLIPVAGRPFVEWQLEWLASNGVHDVVLSVGYLGEMISQFVADGSRWNVRATYVCEQDRLLGTAGALRLAADQGVLGRSFLVLYGDSYLPIEIRPIVEHFEDDGCPALMTVWQNEGLYERSNVAFDGEYVLRYDKSAECASLRFVDYGLSMVSTAMVIEEVRGGGHHDLADLFSKLSREHRLRGYEVRRRFYEIGSERGLRELSDHLRAGVTDRR